MNIWHGKKIYLRAVCSDDLHHYYLKYTVDTRSQRHGDRALLPYGPDMMKERVKKLSMQNPYEEEATLIISDYQNNPVGNINVHSINRINRTFSYGLGIQKEFRKKGYASEAIKLLLGFYFLELNYNKVETKVYSFNPESMGLHEKLGFVKEGVLRQNIYADGRYHDTICYGLTKEEYMKMRDNNETR